MQSFLTLVELTSMLAYFRLVNLHSFHFLLHLLDLFQDGLHPVIEFVELVGRCIEFELVSSISLTSP